MFEHLLPREALAQCARVLRQNKMEDSQSAAKLLLCHVAGTDMHGILACDEPLSREQAAQLALMANRVSQGEPVQYVLGYAYFSGWRFAVTRDVLIPRADTETIVQWARTSASAGVKVLDACTGSGCIAVAIKKLREDLDVCACDISEKALDVARKNAAENDVSVEYRCGDLFTPYRDEMFDVIVANPPYISGEEMRRLPKNVRDYEPYEALYGGNDGLEVSGRLISTAAAQLHEGGRLCIEIGCLQEEAVTDLFKSAGYGDIRVLYDMENRPRAVAGVWEGGL